MSKSRISIGRFRFRVNILDLSNAQDASGGIDPRLVTLFLQTWAAVDTLNGRELYSAQQQNSEVTHKVSIRYAPGILSRQVVGNAGRYYTIQYISDPDGRGKLLELFCSERNDSARLANITPATPTPPQDPRVVTITANYAAVAGDFILVDTTAGPITVTIPLSAGNGGKVISVKKISADANLVTCARSGADLLEFDTSITFDAKGVSAELEADGVAAWVLN
jgi:SPP1 family predicted phage head-tail adaptor